RVAFLKPAVSQPLLRGPPIPSLHQVARDIDAEHVRSQSRRRNRGGAIAASEIQDSEPSGDSKLPHQCLSTVAHRVSNTREVAFFPEGLVRIQRSIHSDIVELVFCGRKYLGA